MMSTSVCRWLFLLIYLSTWAKIASSKEMRVVCYYTNWSVYRPGAAKFSPQNINPYLCTHLIYAFGGFTKENTLKPFDKYQDIEKGRYIKLLVPTVFYFAINLKGMAADYSNEAINEVRNIKISEAITKNGDVYNGSLNHEDLYTSKRGYAKFTGLKTYNKNLKTMLAIGGWNEGSSRFSPMVANAERRKELVKNAIKFLRQNHFDGLDLDWEYPSFRDGGKPRDRDNYAQLVQELREEFERESEKTGRQRLLLTMAVPAGIEYINKGYDVPKLTKYLDWMNILSYDYHSAFEPAVNHHAPLYSLEEDNEYNYDAELSIDYTVKHYMKLGAEPNKLVLGIPTYGRSYTLYNPDAFEMGSPADGPGDMGEATRENGYLAYYEICEYVKNQDWEVEQPNPKAMGPYAFKDNQWVGYDDENIVRKKSEYVAENSLGGIMFWAIDNDDFRGNCHGKPYPLIEAGKEALLNAYGITDDNLISSKLSKPKTRTRSKSTSKAKPSDEENKVSTLTSLRDTRRRDRFKLKAKSEERESSSRRPKPKRKESRKTTETSTYSSLTVVTPSYTTPAPPSTPDLDGAFKCEDEGFFPHPKDCKKYFWCLSGGGDSGIVAHQFNCPAGLYFNKAADSCDYSQNVLCNKKLSQKTTAATASQTLSSTTKTSVLSSTSRAPPRITAATSRTTYTQAPTTEAYEEEDEYEDDEDVEDEKNKGDSEEDPRVIKELIDLIKKAGGIEELEKQLKGTKTDATSANPDSTTQSVISKTLYERVLSKAVKNTLNSKKNIFSNIRNSRGPQNDGLSKSDENTSSGTDRGKLQYTSISRKRPAKSNEDDSENDDPQGDNTKSENFKTRGNSKKSQPEYVTIRRPRVSTTTEAFDTDREFNRNKILGESSDEEEYDDDEDIVDEDEGDVATEDKTNKKTFVPQYVNIRRQRPTTTEESSTSKYTVIRRGSTTESAPEPIEEKDDTTLKYKTIRRGSTPSPSTTEESTTAKYQLLRRGTTQSTTTVAGVSDTTTTSKFRNFRRGSTTQKTVKEEDATSKNNIVRGTTTPGDDENDVTSRYQTLARASTTLRSELEAATESADPIVTTTSGTSDLVSSTSPIPPTQDTDKITTINLFEGISATELSPTTKLGNTTKLEDHTIAQEESVVTTDITDINTETATSQKSQLTDQQSISISSEGPSTTVKSITESTTQTSKVSQSNFKFRLRPKLLELHKDINSKVNYSSTENPITKSTSKYRTRGSSRFGTFNKNGSTNSTENEDNVEEDTKSNFVSRRRPSSTEKYIEENRTFRPSELADLSSLTAVDFSNIKELNIGTGSHRRRLRPAVSLSTASSTILEEDLTQDIKVLPLVRKLSDIPSFQKSRRIVPKKITLDQADSSSEPISTSKRLRAFGSRTTRQPATTESTEDINKESENSTSATVSITPRSRRVVRRFRTTTNRSASNKADDPHSKISLSPFRRRPVITQTKNESLGDDKEFSIVTTTSKYNPLQRLFIKNARIPNVLRQNKVEEESDDNSDDDSSTEEGENIKLSESNIRENSDFNSFDTSGKQRRKLVKLITQKSESLHEKTYYENKNIEDQNDPIEPSINENVTLSGNENYNIAVNNTNSENNTKKTDEKFDKDEETATAENRNQTTTINPTIVPEIVKLQKENAKISTEPNIIIRTRKIIRKIKPTSPTTSSTTVGISTTTESTLDRKRKVIRRLRPVGRNNSDKESTDEKPNDKLKVTQLHIRGRPSSAPQDLEKENTTKRLFRPSINRSKNKYVKPTTELKPTNRTSFRFSNKNTVNDTVDATESSTDTTSNSENFATRRLFRPRLTEQKNVSKGEIANKDIFKTSNRVAFKPFLRTSTTSKSPLSIENSEDITESISNQFTSEKLVMLLSSEDVETQETTQITSTTEASMDITLPEKLFYTLTDAATSTNVSPKAEQLENKDSSSTQVKDEGITTTEEVNSSNEETKPYLESYNRPKTENDDDKFEIAKSSTSIYNLHSSPSTTLDESNENTEIDDSDDDPERDDEEEETDDPEDGEKDRNRNYVSVFRSSTTSNSFNNFDSEFELEEPKFDDIFNDHESHERDDDVKFGDDGYGSTDKDKGSNEHEAEMSGVTSDPSTEHHTGIFEVSSAPSEVIKDVRGEESVETSSIQNKFYRPKDRPAFKRPRVTATAATVEKKTPSRPKYKTFSRTSTKSLTKETIQIHSFNNTGADGKTENAVNKVLLTNRYKYKTLERTTSSPDTDSITSSEITNLMDTEDNDNFTGDNTTMEGISDPLEFTTQILDIDDEGKRTMATRDDATENNILTETTQNVNDEMAIFVTSMENEIFDLTTSASENNPPESKLTTITDELTLQDENVSTSTELSTTEVSTISLRKNEELGLSSKVNNIVQSQNVIKNDKVTTESDAEASTIEYDTTETDMSTVLIPETTTPYHRRSTLRSIESRPKYFPTRRRNNVPRSTTESTISKQNKFGRRERQKSTTERIVAESPSADISILHNKFNALLHANKSLYSYSTTHGKNEQPTTIKLDITLDEKNEQLLKDVQPTTEDMNNNSEIIQEINDLFTTELPATTSEHSVTIFTTVENIEEETQSTENNNEQAVTSENYKYVANEQNDENKKPTVNSSIRTPSKNYNPRSQIIRTTTPRVINRPINSRRRRPISTVRSNIPQFAGKSTTLRTINRPKTFGRTTESFKVKEELSGINTESVKTRNRNLFAKTRKNYTNTEPPIASTEESVLYTTTISSLEVSTPAVEILNEVSNEHITLAPPSTESVTKSKADETTEYLTTLHHVFAEIKDGGMTNIMETTTEPINSSFTTPNGKIERLIEVNRIVQFKTKEAKVKNHVVEEHSSAEDVPVLDKIGEINRVTVIKVVDGNDTKIETVETLNTQDNEIKQGNSVSPVYIPEEAKSENSDKPFLELPAKVEEIPSTEVLGNINVTKISVTLENAPDTTLQDQSNREDRKFEIYGQSKSSDFSNKNQLESSGKAQIIDGISHINIITPRPLFSTESATIALEGLFQTEPPRSLFNSKHSNPSNDEFLETEHSKFVNVRILPQDDSRFNKGIKDKTKFVPIKLLRQDEEVTMKAEVVEIRPKNSIETIKIVPIRVEMSRKIADNFPTFRVGPQYKSKENT